MIGNWEISRLDVPERFFAYADAYLQAAIGACLSIKEHESRQTWPNAAVVLLLSAHSVELFLKGAILCKSPDEALITHRIDDLAQRYRYLYPGEEFLFDIPFETDYSLISPELVSELRKDEVVPSIMYRYPTDRDQTDWKVVSGFDATSFLEILSYLHDRLSDLRKLMGPR